MPLHRFPLTGCDSPERHESSHRGDVQMRLPTLVAAGAGGVPPVSVPPQASRSPKDDMYTRTILSAGQFLMRRRNVAPYLTAVYLAQINWFIGDAHGRAVLRRINLIRSAIPNLPRPRSGSRFVLAVRCQHVHQQRPGGPHAFQPRSTTARSRPTRSGRCSQAPAVSGRRFGIRTP